MLKYEELRNRELEPFPHMAKWNSYNPIRIEEGLPYEMFIHKDGITIYLCEGMDESTWYEASINGLTIQAGLRWLTSVKETVTLGSLLDIYPMKSWETGLWVRYFEFIFTNRGYV